MTAWYGWPAAQRPSRHLGSPSSDGSEPIAIPRRGSPSENRQMDSTEQADLPHYAAYGGTKAALAAAAASSPSAASGSSLYSGLSRQSSEAVFRVDLEPAEPTDEPEENIASPAPLGSWADRQTQYAPAAQYLPAQVPKPGKAKQAGQPQWEADAAWRFRFKHKWRREQIKALVGETAYATNDGGYDDGGWAAAMQLLGAVAPEVGTRLDAWAALATGANAVAKALSTGGSSADAAAELGSADAALAFDEEIASPGLLRHQAAAAIAAPQASAVQVLPGAVPGSTIRKVTMRGAAGKPTTPRAGRQTLAVPAPVTKPVRQLPQDKHLTSTDCAAAAAAGDKLPLLAAKQLAILKAADYKAIVAQKQSTDWVGRHLASVELTGAAVSGVPFITAQLTDLASGATRVLVRGSRGAATGQLVAALKQQVKHTSALHRLPLPRLQVLGGGLLAAA